MKTVCRRTRVTDPAGIWDYSNLIGATVRISSISVGNLNNMFGVDSEWHHTIEDIYFRVTTDGKTITVIRLKDMPDCLFTWKDLEVLDLQYTGLAICGLCCCGQFLCGEGVK